MLLQLKFQLPVFCNCSFKPLKAKKSFHLNCKSQDLQCYVSYHVFLTRMFSFKLTNKSAEILKLKLLILQCQGVNSQ